MTYLRGDWFPGVRWAEASIKVHTQKKSLSSPKMADLLTSSSKLVGMEMANRGQGNMPVGVKFHIHALSGVKM